MVEPPLVAWYEPTAQASLLLTTAMPRTLPVQIRDRRDRRRRSTPLTC